MVTLDVSPGTAAPAHDEASLKFMGEPLTFVIEVNGVPGCAKTAPVRNKAGTRRKAKRFACESKVELCSIFEK